MLRRLLFPCLCIAFLFGCASSKKTADAAAGAPRKPSPLASQLPEGELWRTARRAGFMEMLDALAATDVVYLGERPGAPAADRRMQLLTSEYLADRGRLHAVGLAGFARPAQAALDAYSEASIDVDQLRERTRSSLRPGAEFTSLLPILEFARRLRLPLLALSVESEIEDRVRAGGLEALPEKARRTLPAIGSPSPAAIERAVIADRIVRWFLTAPDDAQIAVLAPNRHLARRTGLPELAFARNGKRYLTLVPLEEGAPPEVFDFSYADFVWIMPKPAS